MKLVVYLLCVAACAAYGLEDRASRMEKYLKEHKVVDIRGGKKTDIEKRPYTAAIIDSRDRFLYGGAVIIAKEWILTAAINLIGVYPGDVAVRIGSNNALKGGISAEISKIILHPNYGGNWTYDIALAKLTKPIKFGKTSKPIEFSNTLPKAGAQTIVSGYGGLTYGIEEDNILREASVPFIPYETCKNDYTLYRQFTSQSFCASKNGVGPCPFDWGDPLVYKNKLIGLFSGSEDNCGSPRFPGVYLDVAQFKDWIKAWIKH